MMSKRRLLGQHFLKSFETGSVLVKAAGLRNSDTVLEIGTGEGFVTDLIVEREPKKIVSYEIGSSLARKAMKRFEWSPKVEIIHGDAFNHENNPARFEVCISSLPYARSLDFVEWLSLRSGEFRVASVIVQQEFGLKLMASPGEMSYRSVSVISQLSFNIETIALVNRHSFSPPPKVSSEIIRIIPNLDIPQPFFTHERIMLLKALFSFRGRILRAAIKGLANRYKVSVPNDLVSKRIEKLSPSDFKLILNLI